MVYKGLYLHRKTCRSLNLKEVKEVESNRSGKTVERETEWLII